MIQISFLFRTFFNSPLIRRKKKSSALDSNASLLPPSSSTKTENSADDPAAQPKVTIDSDDSDDDEENSGVGAVSGAAGSSSKDNGFTNLESFQKKILKQKLKKLNNCTLSGPYPSPPPAPQRVPNPPRKNLHHSTGLLQPSTPLLPRRALNKGLLGHHPGATPTSTPMPTPNTKRRGWNGLLQNQV